ncbi:hypothetical protein [Thalassomonas sp. M1454]|uniref:hypothetical protein n=1 Tax=Thalassomonas sp. M1454 TaxID=2594477 RepID=UPI00117D9AF4|nr:hypothetical protein [Thalassomonas sp. M1454]TRX56607.1 hypothetical protein FNN08_03515 [Thalassomonas sp. M1454]
MLPLSILILINLLSMLLCYFIAKLKGAKLIKWVVWGALLGPLAIPFALFAKKEVGTQSLKNN